MEIEIKENPILITGCARSGTSLIAGIINICGAYGGKLAGGSKYNMKGFFENLSIKNNITKPYLKSIGADPKGQGPLPDLEKIHVLPQDWRQRVQDIMIAQGYKQGPWFVKEAKQCLIWPVWNDAFPNAKWVIVRRKTSDIATSCLNTGFMNRYNTYDDWVKWVNYHEDRFVEMVKAGLNVKIVWPHRMVKGDYSQVMELIEWLGLEWKHEEVMEFIDPKLWKTRRKELKNFKG